MKKRERFDPEDRPPLLFEADDPDLVAQFAVGPAGVGPVMGFGSDDFFPVAPVPDAETQRGSVHPDDHGAAVASSADQPEEKVATSPMTRGGDAEGGDVAVGT